MSHTLTILMFKILPIYKYTYYYGSYARYNYECLLKVPCLCWYLYIYIYKYVRVHLEMGKTCINMIFAEDYLFINYGFTSNDGYQRKLEFRNFKLKPLHSEVTVHLLTSFHAYLKYKYVYVHNSTHGLKLSGGVCTHVYN